MRTLQTPTASVRAILAPVAINKGGTGSDNSIDASLNLNGIGFNLFDQPGGIALSNAESKIDSEILSSSTVSGPTLDGPTVLYSGQLAEYKITNYNSLLTYTGSITNGSVNIIKDKILVTAPAVAGQATLTINGRVIKIEVLSNQPDTPLLTVAHLGSGSSVSLSAQASDFSLRFITGTHLNTDWQVSTSISFNTVVNESLANATNKTTYTVNGLNTSTTYFVRCRYRDNNDNVSNWSNTVTVTTASAYFIQNEEASFSNPRALSGRYGFKVAMDGTGSLVAVSDNSDGQTMGKVHIFTRNGNTWSLQQTLSLSAAENNFGDRGLSINSAGDRLLILSYYACHLYTRSGSTWTKQSSAITTWLGHYFNDCVISPDGTRVAISNHLDVSPFTGEVRIYTVSPTGFTFEATLPNPQGTNTAWVGYNLSLSNNGSYLASRSGNGNDSGTYIFVRTGTAWAMQQWISTGYGASGNGSCTLDGTGTRVVISTFETSTTFSTKVYVRNGTTWSLEQTINNVNNGALTISSAGDQIVLGGVGAMQSWTRSGSVWTLRKTLTFSGSFSGGSDLQLSRDGTRLAIGDGSATVNGASQAGQFYLFTSADIQAVPIIKPNVPSVTAPVNNATNQEVNITFTSSAFVIPGSIAMHSTSDWQVSTDINFTTIVKSITDSLTNRLSFAVTGLEFNKAHFVRVRHKDTNNRYSDWSNSIKFTTKISVAVSAPIININTSTTVTAGWLLSPVPVGTYSGTVSSYTLSGPGNPLGLAIGLTFEGGVIYLSGYVAAGTARMGVTATNAGGSFSSSGNITVNPIGPYTIYTTNWTFPVGQQIPTFTGGRKTIATANDEMFTGSVSSGSLPPGTQLSFNQGANGDVIIGGTPTQPGTYTFTLLCYSRLGLTLDGPKVSPPITITIN